MEISFENDMDRRRHSLISSLGSSLWRNVSSPEPQEKLNRSLRIQYFTEPESALKELTLSTIKSLCLQASYHERCLYCRVQQAKPSSSQGAFVPDIGNTFPLVMSVLWDFPWCSGAVCFFPTLFKARACWLSQNKSLLAIIEICF